MISFSIFNYIIPQLYLNVKCLFNLFSLTGWLLLPSTPDPRRAMWSVSTTLTLYLYYTTTGRVCQVFIILLLRFNSEVGKGIEPHPTNGHTQNNLSNDIQTHGASTISDPVMPASNEWFASPFSFSTYIIPQPIANVKSLLIFF